MPRKSLCMLTGRSLRFASQPSSRHRHAAIAFLLPLLVLTPVYGFAQKRGAEVEIGAPKILEYSRVYPLLDGLFQDVATTQIAALTLNPNQPNASALDALQQVFQLQMQYSASAGIQNNVAAQQSALASNYATFQNQLVQQQSQLLAAQVTAQKQAGEAQKALDSLTNPTAAQTAAANQQVTVATDNLNSINSQLTDVQNTLSKSLTVNPSFTSIAPSMPTSAPALPSVTPALPSGPSNYSPNFPATKQMDNQITLLWERLARLVETLNQGNNPDDTLYLVEFDTNIVPRDRKHQLLNILYPLACGQGDSKPYVVDMYPRNAAVNVMDEKYRETKFGLGALLSFFSFGLNASYNRDHLQITQALSQSSYITGYGIGENTVGWLYGISLGDDSIAPGVRSVYALIAVPRSCNNTGAISPPVVTWTKNPSMTPPSDSHAENSNAAKAANATTLVWSEAKPFPAPSNSSSSRCPKGCVLKIMYSPMEYDSTATTAPVMVTVSLDQSQAALDKEEMINVNGRYLQRARDNFGRAIAGTGITGSGGILETSALSLNTWMPVSSTTFVMNLDGITFANRFPNILLQSPRGVIDVTNSFVPAPANDPNAGPEVIISGVHWYCSTNCGDILPALARLKQAVAKIAVARWTDSAISTVDNQVMDQLCITVADTPGSQSPATQSTANAPLQVITDANRSVWGTRPVVLLDTSTGITPLAVGCRAFGARWVCPVLHDLRQDDLVIRIVDPDHAGGLFVGRGMLNSCTEPDCSNPFVWDNPTLSWNDLDFGAHNAWTLRLKMVNLQQGDKVKLTNDKHLSLQADELNCQDFSKPCEVQFSIAKDKFDSITPTTRLQVFTADDKPRGTPSSLGLRAAIMPVVSDINTAQDNFKGSNLVFNKIQIGANAKPIRIDCNANVDASQCVVPKYDPDGKGLLYFVTDNGLVPMVRASDNVQILHDPQAVKAAATPQAKAAEAGAAAQQPSAVGAALPLVQKKPTITVYQNQK